jgi:hypothetical protein
MTDHAQVPVVIEDRTVLVDQAIAPLIKECHRAGVRTWLSCQAQERVYDGHSEQQLVGGPWAWLALVDETDLKGLLDAILWSPVGVLDRSDVLGLWNRIFQTSRREQDCFLVPGAWRFEISPVEADLDGEMVYDPGAPPGRIHVGANVRFPVSDIGEVTQRLRAWNDRW